MNIGFFKNNEKDIFIEMCKEFYNSGATNHPIPLEYMENTFNASLKDNKTNLFCYKIRNDELNIVGYALVCVFWSNEVGGNVCFLDELYIKKEYRGNNLGRTFLEFLINEFNNKVNRFRLEACESNDKAIKLYKDYGFEFLNYRQMVKDKYKIK